MILNSEDAANRIQNELLKVGISTSKYHTHHNRSGSHVNLIEERAGNMNITHHVKFSKEPFKSMGSYFKNYRGELGDSLDERALENLGDEDILYFSFPDVIYKVKKSEFVKPRLWRQNRQGVWTCSYALSDMEIFYRSA